LRPSPPVRLLVRGGAAVRVVSAGDGIPLGERPGLSGRYDLAGPARPSAADGRGGVLAPVAASSPSECPRPQLSVLVGEAGVHVPRRPPLDGGSPVPHLPADLKTRRPGSFPLPATQRRQRHLQHHRHVLLGQQTLVVAHHPGRHGAPPIVLRPADRLVAEPAAETRTLSGRPLPIHILAPALAATYGRSSPGVPLTGARRGLAQGTGRSASVVVSRIRMNRGELRSTQHIAPTLFWARTPDCCVVRPCRAVVCGGVPST